MHRILTFFVGLYWMTHFALLAVRPAAASAAGLRMAGLEGELASALIVGAALVAVLFLWLLVALLLEPYSAAGDVDDVARWAFAAASGMLTLALAAGASQPTALLSHTSLPLAALLASYVAVRIEGGWLSERVKEDGGQTTGATLMALDAAHNSLLSRFSGRPSGEERP